MAEPLIIVGNGMAATRLADELSRHALGRYAVAVIGDEPRLAYNRVLLSPLLAGEIAEPEIELKPAAWWQARGVSMFYGKPVTGIDRAAKCVTLADGLVLPYGKLVLATGSRPLMPPVPGLDLPGVASFRDVADVALFRTIAATGARVVVIGGGLLGLEAAYGLARIGGKVTLLHLADRLMERQLDREGAGLLAGEIAARGIDIRLNRTAERFVGKSRVEAVELNDGSVIPADLVVVAIGVRPRVDLAVAAGLDVNRGIDVDDGLASSDPSIFAIGECAEHRGLVYGLVEPAYEQARVLAARLAGVRERYTGSLLATNLKVSGVSVFSAGSVEPGEDDEVLLLRDPAMGVYRKFLLRAGRLAGCVLVGDTSGALFYLGLIRSGQDISAIRADLPFGEGYCIGMAA
ncbi:Assimilatory nitrate reductase (NADH) beta subunit [Bosea sp. 62]|uniref:NAD(P)/FAD-dependent oxidoreductase n=1 Tax=unclassified Bosea (in: a-proteobacteria) TaxID=2653178 RepID=UPI0012566745|nr:MULTISPECIES: FAD-dependent oxidoreductase [unclassified Bosea (in: a-proteobacteria)]CAD5293659.1 Assimilatory nitrate reductase (NADH) beta subunit [Bosea sp. 21B]CAD5294228.1 Assimilatory nitrate reductase (NADH) beta subunit [Bosea sp. 46]CAD5299155.1 Assimilatory nitrate reductase (NADH) beta subunit [Bosea sp. 7B]VVT60788.1 Assimilatory nitrate reductase (NADH) beta subunit [Bosea sp. EC-HK365B]VXB41383.1 Assimilatory nitrate reductase (NADH) beta subunit [Bosea sp. 127]